MSLLVATARAAPVPAEPDSEADEPAVTLPEPIDLPPIPYPAGVDAGPETVVVEITLDAEGRVQDIEVVEGREPFAGVLVEAVRATRFTPALEDGVPIPVVVPLTWEFLPPAVDVAGVVRRRGDRQPVPGLVVAVGEHAVTTDQRGRFALRDVEPGTWSVRVPAPEVSLPETEITLEEGERLDLELWVTESAWAREAVATYRSEPAVGVRRTLSHDEIAGSPGSLGDPVRALQNVPGPVRTPLDAGWLLVRGGNPDDTGVYLDGVRVPQLYHLGGFTSILHPEMVEAVDFHPGTPPARLGRSLSGAAEIRSRRVAGDLRALGGVNLAWAHAYAEAPLGERSGVALSARRSYLDAVLATVLSEEQASIAPRFWDAEARLDTPHLGLLVIGLSDQADAPVEDGDIATIGQRALQIQGRAEADTPLGEARFLPWVGMRTQTVIAPLRDEKVRDLFPGARAELVSAPWKGATMRLGVEGEYHRWRIERDQDRRGDPFGYVDPYAEIAFGDRLHTRLGLRLDTLFVGDQLPRLGWSPRLDLRWRLHDDLALVAEAGRFHQQPPALWLVAFPDGPYLDLEHASSVSLGTRWSPGPLALDVDLWARRSSAIVVVEEDGSIGAADGLAAGGEAWLRGEWSHTRFAAMYQYTHTVQREEPGMPWRPTLFDQPHAVNLILRQRLPRDISLGARWRYASGYPVDDEQTAFDLLTQQESVIAVGDSGRTAPYHALDVRASKRFTWRAWRLDVYLDLQNVYMRRIPEPAINGIDETILAYGFGLPMLPIFGIDAVFWP